MQHPPTARTMITGHVLSFSSAMLVALTHSHGVVACVAPVENVIHDLPFCAGKLLASIQFFHCGVIGLFAVFVACVRCATSATSDQSQGADTDGDYFKHGLHVG